MRRNSVLEQFSVIRFAVFDGWYCAVLRDSFAIKTFDIGMLLTILCVRIMLMETTVCCDHNVGRYSTFHVAQGRFTVCLCSCVRHTPVV